MRLRKVLCGCVFFTALCINAVAQQFVFRINFTDKTGSPSLSNPLAFLSQRAIDRRAAQSISVDSTDRPVSPAYINDVLSTTAGKFHCTSRWMNSMVILLSDSSKIALLTSKPYIGSINYIGYFLTPLHKTTPTPINQYTGSTAKTTGTSAYYGASYDQTRLVNGDYLHDRGYKGKGKLIAIMDEGFVGVDTGPAFDSMMQSGRMVDKYNFVNASTDVFSSYDHGTGCLSTIAGNIPGTYVGSAPEANFAIYVSEYRSGDYPVEMDQMVAATERADSIGADIVVSSLGYNWFSGGGKFPDITLAEIDGKTTFAARGANMAAAKGMLFVITAGNEGGNTWNKILTPGDADSAITVGSVSNGKFPASNSGFGPNAAGQIKPDVCMQGSAAAIMLGSATPTSGTGTSYATPQLAGWAACLWQANKSSKASDVKTAIQKSGHVYTTPGAQLGYGVPDFYKASEYLKIKDTPDVLSADNWVTIVPNPVEQTLQLRVYMLTAENVSFQISDVAGKKIFSSERKLQTGKQDVIINLPAMAPGEYILRGETRAKSITLRFVKH